MADTAVLKEYLVKIAYQLDASSVRRVEGATAGIVAGLGNIVKAATAASAAFVAYVAAGADNLERLYFIGQRTKASVEGIQATSYALSQLGSSAGGAVNAIEAIAKIMRTSPGGESWLGALGVNTKQDTAKILEDVISKLKDMPYYRANAYAQFLGIDETTLQALMADVGKYTAIYQTMLKQANVNSDRAAEASHRFMVEVRTLGTAFEVLRLKVTQTLTDRMASSIRRWRTMITDNFGDVAKLIEKGGEGILWIVDAFVTLGVRANQAVNDVIAFYNSFDEGTRNTMKVLAELAALWAVVNAAFALSPIGRVVALSAALLILYDDYSAFKEGSEHLIDWDKWGPEIDNAVRGIRALINTLKEVKDFVVWLDQYDPTKFLWRQFRDNVLPNVPGGTPAPGAAPGPEAPGSGARAPWWRRMFSPSSYAGGDRQGSGDVQQRANSLIENLVRDLGLTPEQAAGIASNLAAESGIQAINERSPVVPGSRGGFGWAQWTGSRRTAFEAWAQQRGLDVNSQQANYGFLLHELNTTHRGVLDSVRGTRTAREAAGAFFPYESGNDPRLQHLLPGHSSYAEPFARGYRGTSAPAPNAGGSINQTVTISVHGGGDPDTAAQRVRQALQRNNADLLRYSGSALT